jgi:hypothetical protein
MSGQQLYELGSCTDNEIPKAESVCEKLLPSLPPGVRASSFPRSARHATSHASRFDTCGRDRALAFSQSVDIEARASSSGLKSTVGHGKAPQVLGASRKALKILVSSPPSERTIKKFGVPGRPMGAGAEGELAAPLLDSARDHHRFRIRRRRIRCCAVTTLAYGLAPDWLWLAI